MLIIQLVGSFLWTQAHMWNDLASWPYGEQDDVVGEERKRKEMQKRKEKRKKKERKERKKFKFKKLKKKYT